jgi:transcriptional regulator with XRE-family HTH domain
MSDPRLKAFGMAVRRLRNAEGISQEDFADVAKIDRSYVGQIERGERNISLSKVFLICDALHVTPSDLFLTMESVEQDND